MKYTKFNNYSNTFVFDTWIKWESITIFWWIHWNEIAWIKTINMIIENLSNQKLKLLKWKLILAYWNEEAIKIWKRDYNYNLNRLFKDEYLKSNSDEYEIIRAKQLSEIMNKSDVLLDIHSVSSDSVPFIFCENIEKEIKIVSNIYNWKTIIWWWDIAWDLLSWGTDWYMHKLWKIAYTLECWNHNSENASDIWFKASLNLLNYFWLILYNNLDINWKNELIEMYKIQTTKSWNFEFEKWMSNFKIINKWDLIWIDWDIKVYAEDDFIILLPNYEKTKIWEEIFYYWKKLI